MNIALITDDFLPHTGGITNVMVNVSKFLKMDGEKVFILNSTLEDKKNSCFKILSSNKKLHHLKSQNSSFYFFLGTLFLKILFLSGIKLKKRFLLAVYYCCYPKNLVNRLISIKNLVGFFKDNKIDVILSGKAAHPLFYSFILSKWFKIPVATIAHGDDFIVSYPFQVNTIIFQNLDRIIVTNCVMKRLIKRVHNLREEKLSIINLGVNIESSNIVQTKEILRKKYNISPNHFILLTVSRFYPRKGFETILRAIELILKQNPDLPIYYYIIGSGEEEERIKGFIKELKIEERVKLLGFLEDSIKNEYYKASDLFVLVPNVKKESIEGFGIVYLEANYFKLPVIGSDSGGVKIAVKENVTGLLIKPGDFNDLKEKILFLYNDAKLRAEMGENGHQRVIREFDWKKNALVYKEILQQLI
ncbi:MAG: glycosyltransferase family 4 protein [Promethearchaeota archaeon]